MKLKYLASACSLAMGIALTIPTAVFAAQYDDNTAQGGANAALSERATMSKSAEEFDDVKVVNNAGEEIGDVEAIVQDRNSGNLHAVVEVGGFLGLGEKKVTIPVDQLSVKDDNLLAPLASTEDELKARTEYQEDLYTELPDEQLIEVGGANNTPGPVVAGQGTDASSQGSSTRAGFGSLDADHDGYLSQNEALAAGPDVVSNWNEMDKNQDGRIDQSEFSAFETSESTGMDSEVGAPSQDNPSAQDQQDSERPNY